MAREYTDEQAAAMVKHGYPTDLLPRGVGGGPGRVYCGQRGGGPLWARNRVCFLDGIEIDGHERSDITLGSDCIHCGQPLTIDDE